jgi:hypothetical protein
MSLFIGRHGIVANKVCDSKLGLYVGFVSHVEQSAVVPEAVDRGLIEDDGDSWQYRRPFQPAFLSTP